MPKTIYSLWLQGAAAAPPAVRLNFARWARLNPDYQFHILDQADATQLLAGTNLALANLPPQALSDIIRARLLSTEGGIWVDASLYPVKPLSIWLPETGFFAFERPGPDRLLSSWFLAVAPGNLLMARWWQQVQRYWRQPRQLIPGTPANPAAFVAPEAALQTSFYPYFWFHYLFAYLVTSDPEAAALWQHAPKLPAGPAHHVQSLCAAGGQPTDADFTTSPVQKLNWRENYQFKESSFL